jgi:hypothetical protein
MQTLMAPSMQIRISFSWGGVLAKQPQNKCTQGEYSKRMTNARPYRLKGIEGQAVYGDVAEKGEFQPADNVCVALFDLQDKRLVANVATATGGLFKFANLARGSYVLIVP